MREERTFREGTRPSETIQHFRPASPAEIAQAATAGREPSGFLVPADGETEQATGGRVVPLYAFPELEQD